MRPESDTDPTWDGGGPRVFCLSWLRSSNSSSLRWRSRGRGTDQPVMVSPFSADDANETHVWQLVSSCAWLMALLLFSCSVSDAWLDCQSLSHSLA